jgi:hypothetical protein
MDFFLQGPMDLLLLSTLFESKHMFENYVLIFSFKYGVW